MSTLLTFQVSRRFLATFKMSLIVSLDALVTLFVDRGLVGDVRGVHVDLVRLGSFDRQARNNVKSNVNKLVMEMNLFGSNTNTHKNKV
jgi:hypothetical protein